MRMEKDDKLYIAIEEAIHAIFDCEIPTDCPFETTELFVAKINEKLGDLEGEEETTEFPYSEVKFKKGDKVISLIDDECGVRKGMHGIVRQDYSSCPYVDWIELNDFWAIIEDFLELE